MHGRGIRLTQTACPSGVPTHGWHRQLFGAGEVLDRNLFSLSRWLSFARYGQHERFARFVPAWQPVTSALRSASCSLRTADASCSTAAPRCAGRRRRKECSAPEIGGIPIFGALIPERLYWSLTVRGGAVNACTAPRVPPAAAPMPARGTAMRAAP